MYDEGAKGSSKLPFYNNFVFLESMKFIAVFLAIFLAVLLVLPSQARGYDPLKEGWALPVVVIPPEKGWDSPEGRSLKSGLAVYEAEVSRARWGVGGYDIVFVGEDSAEGAIAFISFVEGREGMKLVEALGTAGPVVLSAFGEDLVLQRDGKMLPYAFALDLPRGCVGAALGRHIRFGHAGKSFAFMADPIDRYMRPKIRGFTDETKSLKVSAFWLQSGVSMESAFAEMKKLKVDGVVSFLGATNTQYLWAKCRKENLVFFSALPLWALSPLLEGTVTADQGWPLKENSSVRSFTTKVFDVTRETVERPDWALRAYAAASWIGNALNYSLEREDQPGSKDVMRQGMEKASPFALGSQVLLPDAATHRPKERKVAILKLQEGKFVLAEELRIPSRLELEPVF
ncbi:MAG: hypothetical protein ABC360_02055 [Acetomicrobium sp.]